MKGRVALYGFGGGSGGSGAALTVKAPAGVTVTVSKDGKSKNKTANSSGIAVFKGLSTGEWTVTITDGEKTASKPVTIIADFNKSITFFSATIHVTYPAGSTCTATNGTTTLTAPDTSGTWDCVVPNAGTWTIAVNGKDFDSVEITDDGMSVNAYPGYLFYYGKQDMKWESKALVQSTGQNMVAYAPKVTTNADGSVTVTYETGSNRRRGGYINTEKIDFSKISSITVIMDYMPGTTNARSGIYVLPEGYTSYQGSAVANLWIGGSPSETGIYVLDVSDVNIDAYLFIAIYGASGTASTTIKEVIAT